MHILTIGLNYKTAPVEIRERFSIQPEVLPAALHKLKQTKSILECVIVATCNRTEIYAVVDRLQVCGHYIRSFMEEWFGVPMEDFVNHLYTREDQAALDHLFRVTSGLDSMIIGETQILGQIRDAFLLAQKEKTTGTLFNQLFKQAVTMAKKAHAETSIGEHAVSVSYAAVELGKRIFGDFKDKHIMIVGAGKMSELTVKHLHANGASRITVVNRTLARAKELANKFKGEACTLEEMHERLKDTDIMISSTGSADYVLTRDQAEQVMQKRKSRPLFLIDIAVPRDLDPAMNSVSNVFLYDIDDLEGIVESNIELRRQESRKIEQMIKEEIREYEQWYKTLEVVPVIRALQEKSAAVHEEVMDNLWKKLPDLDEHERKVIRKLTKSIVNQMLHDPILRIKDMAAERSGDEAVEMFSRIFALEDTLKQQEERASVRSAEAEPTTVKQSLVAVASARNLFARS
jgi:glutamyl-tRNA reductase